MPRADDVERGALAGRAHDRDADAVVAARRKADLRREERLAAALLGAPEEPGPVTAAHMARSGLAQLVARVAGDAAGERLPERIARRGADHGRVIELVVGEQRRVRSAARRAVVLHPVDGGMLGAGKARDARELRERDAVAALARGVALGAAHAVLGSQWVVHRATLLPESAGVNPSCADPCKLRLHGRAPLSALQRPGARARARPAALRRLLGGDALARATGRRASQDLAPGAVRDRAARGRAGSAQEAPAPRWRRAPAEPA